MKLNLKIFQTITFLFIAAHSLSAFSESSSTIFSSETKIDVGVELVKKIDQRFAPFFENSGFKNEAELFSAIDNSSEIYYKTAKKLLMNEELVVAIATPEKYRESILNAGRLKSSHETNASEGSLMQNRDAAEAAYAHMTYEEYRKLDNVLKPKYGFLRSKSNEFDDPKGVWSYGTDRFILKMDKIRERLTLSLGDSLNFVALTMGGENETEVSVDMNTWDGFFVPWSRRALFIPFLGQGIGYNQNKDQTYLQYTKEYSITLPEEQKTFKGKIGLPIQTFLDSEKNLSDMGANSYTFPTALAKHDEMQIIEWTNQYQDFPIPLTGSLSNFKYTHNWSLDYIEAQIWGEITLDDVAAFEFTESKPSDDFLNRLKAKGIEIRDLRKNK